MEDNSDKKTDKSPRTHSLVSRFKKLVKTRKGKIILGIAVVILILATLLIIPATRYATYGQLVRKNLNLTVLDEMTGQPISNAKVEVDSISADTAADGRLQLNNLASGNHAIKLSKKYYKSVEVNNLLPLFSSENNITIKMKAVGKQVKVIVINSVTKQAIPDAEISASGANFKTNTNGNANLVLPLTSKQKITATHDGYNTKISDISVDLSKSNQTYSISLTPNGSIVYLSKATGKINVMRSNLDGSEATTLVEGTGNEDDNTTSLLSTRDWKYAVLLSRREGTAEKIYLVDKLTGKLSLIDEGNVSFELAGWSGHTFVYKINRAGISAWIPKAQAVKFYNADTGQLSLIEESSASGSWDGNYQYESISTPYILDGEVVYLMSWSFGQYVTCDVTQKAQLITVNPASKAKKTVQAFDQTCGSSMSSKLYEPQGLYIRSVKDGNYSAPSFFEYENGKVESKKDTTPAKFYSPYPTYLISPTGSKSLWYEERDGKNTIFVGDKAGNNAKQIAEKSEFKPYGWFGDKDEYILLSKNGSELYISTADQLGDQKNTPLKITDYHKPARQYEGYGYGYGGL